MLRSIRSSLVRRKRTRGQAMSETAILTAGVLLGVGSIASFAPDMFAAFTIYIRGFYLILGFPLG